MIKMIRESERDTQIIHLLYVRIGKEREKRGRIGGKDEKDGRMWMMVGSSRVEEHGQTRWVSSREAKSGRATRTGVGAGDGVRGRVCGGVEE